MMKFFSVIALIVVLGLPSMASASERLVLVQQSGTTSLPAAGSEIDAAHVLTVGAGVIVGALAVSSVLNFQGAGLLGAVTGGLLADWWYGERHDYIKLERKQ